MENKTQILQKLYFFSFLQTVLRLGQPLTDL